MQARSSSSGRRESSCVDAGKGVRGWFLDPRRILSLEEVRPLRGAAMTSKAVALRSGARTLVRDCFVVECVLSTGLRVSELAGLNCGDVVVNPDLPGVVVERGKGGRTRFVRVGLAFLGVVREFITWKSGVGESVAPDAPVFFSCRSGRLTARALQKSFARSLERAGIVGHSIHDGRHSYATYLLKASRNIRLVQQQLGHARVTTTEVYAQVLGEELQDGLEGLSQLYGRMS